MVELSVPLLKGRDQKTLVRDVRISNRQPWAAQHWKTILSCYSRSPWFDHYRAELEELYRQKWEWLIDWDLACFEWSLKALGVQRAVGLTDEWRREYDAGTVADWRGRWKRGGVGGQGELGRTDEAAPGAAMGVGDGVTRYRQVFEERTGFIPDLSILDLLFCEGKQSIRYIRSS